jgi:CHAT domain-containing protein
MVQFKTLFLIAAICCLFAKASAQQQAALKEADRIYQEAEKLYNLQQDSLALIKLQQAKKAYLATGTVVPKVANICFGMGVIYYEKQDFTQAIRSYKEYIAISRKINPHVDSIFLQPLVLIGTCFTNLNRYDSAYAYYKQAEHLLQRYPQLPLNQQLRFHNETGSLLYLFGNYTQSINHFEKALNLLEHHMLSKAQPSRDDTNRYVIYNNNIAGAMGKMGQYQRAINRTKKLIKYGLIQNKLYQHIASLYLQLEKPDSAKIYLEKIDIPSISTSEKANYYTNLGTVHSLTDNYQEALINFDKAQQISLASFGKKNGWLGNAYSGKGKVYESQKKWKEALAHYQLAIQALHFTFNSADIYRNPVDLSHAASPLLLFKTLQQKAHAFRQYFAQTRKLTDLEASLQTYQLAFELANRIRKSYDSDEAKLFFTNTVAPVYEEAIGTAYRLYQQTGEKVYLESALALAEQSKAAVLAESLRELEIKQVPGIPASLLRREKELQLNISALNIRLVETTDSVRKETYRDRLRDSEIELAKTVKAFENNKQYYQLKYDTSSVHVSQLQKMLDTRTALVEYFTGRQHMYVFVVTPQSFEVKQLPLPATFQQDWQVLYQNLYQSSAGSRYKGDAPAYRLHQQVFSPVADLLAGKQHLIIVPDKELSYLPFEALVTDEKTNQYLLRDYSISYAYSGKLLLNASGHKAATGELSILAMAPFVTGNPYEQNLIRGDVLDPLYASLDEVKQVGGQIYLAQAATKEEFLRQAANHDIIHLATHAKADNQDPLNSFIAFYPHTDSLTSYRLYAQELYNMHLEKLKLIVLSACETNSGKLIQGEGVMSLARAFAYAGCPSIVTTLWKADDKTSADISVRMHGYLKEGKSKDEALRQAKLDYIASQTHIARRSPVYWANFIFIGDHSAIYPDNSFPWWLPGALAAGLTVLLLWLAARRTRRHKPRKALH